MIVDQVTCVIIEARIPPDARRCKASTSPRVNAAKTSMGLRVATVSPDDKVLFKTVTIARDLGREIELASGVNADDRIITAPPDGLADGDPVRVVGPGAKGKPTASEKQDPKG